MKHVKNVPFAAYVYAIVVMTLASSLFVALIGCNTNTKKISKRIPIKIGANFTLTGNTSFWSTELKKGLDMVIDEVKDSSTRYEFKVIYDDNKGKPNEAVNIFNKFATIDSVNVVFSCFTPISQPLRELADKHKIPLIATATAINDFGKQYEWSFRDFITHNQQVPRLAEYAFKKLNLKKGTYLVVNDDYGLSGAKVFGEVFTKLGGSFYEGEKFEQKDLNMRNIINKVLINKPEFILIIGRDQSLATTFNQVREVNKDIQIIGVNSFDVNLVWNAIKDEYENNILFSSAYVDLENNLEARKFSQSYFRQYNEMPSYVSIYGYTIGKYL